MVALGLLCAANPVSGAPVDVSLTYHVSSVDAGITSIAVGDRFTIDLTIEDSTTDTEPSTSHGHFPGLLTAWTVTPDPGNAGTWTPSGTWDESNGSYVTAGANITMQVRGTGFPDSGGGAIPFFDVILGFDWPDTLNDSGTGDTWAQQLGAAFGVPPAVQGGAAIRFRVSDIDFRRAEMVLVDAVPTARPEVLLLLAVALMALGALALRRPHVCPSARA
jgi:hypothetical protein